MTPTFRNFALLSTMSRIGRAAIAILIIFLALIGFAEARTHPIGALGFLLLASLIFAVAWFKKAKRSA